MERCRDFNPFMKGFRIFGMVIFGLVAFVVISLIFGFIVESLWNWLMPVIFKLPKISYWQAFGIIILGKLIFGGVGPRSLHRKHWHQQHDFPDRLVRNGDFQQFRHPWHEHRDTPWPNRDYYEEWWDREGKFAFENYIKRIANESGQKKEPENQ